MVSEHKEKGKRKILGLSVIIGIVIGLIVLGGVIFAVNKIISERAVTGKAVEGGGENLIGLSSLSANTCYTFRTESDLGAPFDGHPTYIVFKTGGDSDSLSVRCSDEPEVETGDVWYWDDFNSDYLSPNGHVAKSTSWDKWDSAGWYTDASGSYIEFVYSLLSYDVYGYLEAGDTNGCAAGDCGVAVCGNNITEGGEVCDGNNQSCTIGGYNGMQECNPACDGWETCVASESCGDNLINGLETCDGTSLGSGAALTGFMNVSAGGFSHSCAVLSNGTVKCWGRNNNGQLGIGSADFNNHPLPALVSGITNAVQAGNGDYHSCAVLSDGGIKCWGLNEFGRLGDGTTTQKNTPVQVSGITNAIQVSAGGTHSCAVLSNGTVKCWGNNINGQLGDNTTTNRLTPISVYGINNAVQVSAGSTHSCAVLSDGTAKCWGDNTWGKLGDGTLTQRRIPVAVSGIANAIQMDAGSAHTCAVLSNGTALCWGNNGNGQLGDGTKTSRNISVQVLGITNATQISAGSSHTCALLSDNTIECWGYNFYGNLGDGTTTNSNISVQVLGITNAVQIGVGSPHTCALLSDNTIKCWGYNFYGQLGDGTTTNRNISVEVIGATPTCESEGYLFGTIGCSVDCLSLDDSDCSTCGNNIVEGTEECDDGANLTVLNCGIGACANSVSDSCVSCINITCTPGLPSNETCNNIDDDCDGDIDEYLNRSCYSWLSGTEGVGNCKAGLQTCSLSIWGSCIGEVGPVQEICGNGIDDNCNGQTDEGCTTSGGGGHAPIIVVINDEMFRGGYSNNAAANSEFRFNAAGGVHTLRIVRVVTGEVRVIISSEPIELTLKIGDKKEVDVNADGTPDLTIELLGINGDLADFRIKAIIQEVPSPVPEEIPEVEAPSPEVQEPEISNSQLYILVAVAALSISLVIVWLILKNKSKTAVPKKIKRRAAKRIKKKRRKK